MIHLPVRSDYGQHRTVHYHPKQLVYSIGSASCGPRLAEQYRLDDASFDFSIRLIPEKA